MLVRLGQSTHLSGKQHALFHSAISLKQFISILTLSVWGKWVLNIWTNTPLQTSQLYLMTQNKQSLAMQYFRLRMRGKNASKSCTGSKHSCRAYMAFLTTEKYDDKQQGANHLNHFFWLHLTPLQERINALSLWEVLQRHIQHSLLWQELLTLRR